MELSKEEIEKIITRLKEYHIKHEIDKIIFIGQDDTCEMITLEEGYST